MERQTAAEIYANDFGVSVDEALRRLDRQSELSALLDQLTTAESSRLAGSGFSHAPAFEAWIFLKGTDVASHAAKQIADAHPDLTIRTGASYTRDELLQLAAELSGRTQTSHTMSDSIRADMTGIGIDQRNNKVVVSIEPAKFNLYSTSDLPSEVAASVTFVAERAPVHEYIRGGQSVGGCTSGFAVADDSDPDDRGMTTAGHCSWPDDMHGHDVTVVRARHNSRVDALWFRPDDADVEVRDDYRCGHNNNAICDLTDVDYTPEEDRFVCHYGKTTGYSCGTIADATFQPPASYCPGPHCNATFIKITGSSLLACGGDSGGPWFASGGVAIGVHSGSANFVDEDDCDDVVAYAIASRSDETESQLSVEFVTD